MNARRALAFIFCTVTLDVLALGIMLPVLPTIVLGFMDGDTAAAARVFGLFATVWGDAVPLLAAWARCRTATGGGR
jgi:DHA1 family tetracycline resistance protein-like MFS transporter